MNCVKPQKVLYSEWRVSIFTWEFERQDQMRILVTLDPLVPPRLFSLAAVIS